MQAHRQGVALHGQKVAHTSAQCSEAHMKMLDLQAADVDIIVLAWLATKIIWVGIPGTASLCI